MTYDIIAIPCFKHTIKKLAKRYPSLQKDYEALIAELKENPQSGIDLGGGLRKIRMRITDKNKGKSAGARVITLTVIVSEENANLNLVCIYDKSDCANLTISEIHLILKESGLE